MSSSPPPLPHGTQPTRAFIRSLIWYLPLHLFVAIMLLGGAAVYYGISVSGHGTWAMLSGWSLTALYLVAALIGGTATALLKAAEQVMAQVERSLRDFIHTLPDLATAAVPAERTLLMIRQEYERVVDHSVSQTSSRLRLPRWIAQVIRAALRGLVVNRFIASCTERGLTVVAPQEFRNWLLAEGLSLGFMLIQDQLAWWRYLIISLLGLLVVLALTLALLTT